MWRKAFILLTVLVSISTMHAHRFSFGAHADWVTSGLSFRYFIVPERMAFHVLGIYYYYKTEYRETTYYSGGVRFEYFFNVYDWIHPYIGVGTGYRDYSSNDKQIGAQGAQLFAGIRFSPFSWIKKDASLGTLGDITLEPEFDISYLKRDESYTDWEGYREHVKEIRFGAPFYGIGLYYNW